MTERSEGSRVRVTSFVGECGRRGGYSPFRSEPWRSVETARRFEFVRSSAGG